MEDITPSILESGQLKDITITSPHRCGDYYTVALYERIRSTTVPRFVSRDPDKFTRMSYKKIRGIEYERQPCLRLVLIREAIFRNNITTEVLDYVTGALCKSLFISFRKEIEESKFLVFRAKDQELIVPDSSVLLHAISSHNWERLSITYAFLIGQEVDDFSIGMHLISIDSKVITQLEPEQLSERENLLCNITSKASWLGSLIVRYIFEPMYYTLFSKLVATRAKIYKIYELHGLELALLSDIIIPDFILQRSVITQIIYLVEQRAFLYPKYCVVNDYHNELILATYESADLNRHGNSILKINPVSGICTVHASMHDSIIKNQRITTTGEISSHVEIFRQVIILESTEQIIVAEQLCNLIITNETSSITPKIEDKTNPIPRMHKINTSIKKLLKLIKGILYFQLYTEYCIIIIDRNNWWVSNLICLQLLHEEGVIFMVIKENDDRLLN